MATITATRAPGKRKHNPEIQRMKRVARNLGIAWADVTAERDRLRREELQEREYADELHKEAARFFGGVNAMPFWRGYFARRFSKLISSGGDYTSVPGFDLFVQEFESTHNCGDLGGGYLNAGRESWTLDAAWELLITDRPPLLDMVIHYKNAVVLLAVGVIAGEAADAFSALPTSYSRFRAPVDATPF